jgi:hypothetical protein
MKQCDTYIVDLYIGCGSNDESNWHQKTDIERRIKLKYKDYLREYCDTNGACFSVTDIDYIYTHGSESGVKITLINYPRFPNSQYIILDNMIEVAKELKHIGNQKRCSIVSKDVTYMLEEDE